MNLGTVSEASGRREVHMEGWTGGQDGQRVPGHMARQRGSQEKRITTTYYIHTGVMGSFSMVISAASLEKIKVG